MARIMILEPYPLLRLGLVQLLSGLGTDTILHSQGNLTENETPAEHYDLVLMSIGEINTQNRIQEVEQLFTPDAILLMGEAPTLPNDVAKISPTIAGYIASSSPSEVLQAAVRLVLAGGTCFPRKTEVATPVEIKSDPIVTAYTPIRWPPAIELSVRPPKSRREHEMLGLTPRQYEVLVLLAQGHPMKMIGRKLNISVATAKAHTETLYQRLNVHNRNAAVYAAVSRGAKLGWASLANNTFDTDMMAKEVQRA
ncbi:MAG: hypothetical protein CML16_04230 [Pusillimonas sp.]|nr:hypothetical protein [Pusillimonas sp.]MBC41837.1 hypothetical protein [Pusillimonas sp.]|tara:strand:+ start:16002 stop:16760 length:759 start_codon:yes stop_codon:yes gene_type:complete